MQQYAGVYLLKNYFFFAVKNTCILLHLVGSY